MYDFHRTAIIQARHFAQCSLNEKLLFTGFLLVAATAYLMALTLLYAEYQYIDDEPGLSVRDIAENYYGNRSGTILEKALRSNMAAYIEFEERNKVVAWLQSGVPQDRYQAEIEPLFKQRCVPCHSGDAPAKNLDLSNYDDVLLVANIDTGVSLHSLIRISHIHLFGIALVALGIGLVFRHASLPQMFHNTITLLPFLAIFIDIGAWFLTKWDPVYAYTIVVAGMLLGIAWGLQIAISLYQIWWPGRHASNGQRN